MIFLSFPKRVPTIIYTGAYRIHSTVSYKHFGALSYRMLCTAFARNATYLLKLINLDVHRILFILNSIILVVFQLYWQHE